MQRISLKSPFTLLSAQRRWPLGAVTMIAMIEKYIEKYTVVETLQTKQAM